jgi:hypothetical protein
MTVHIPRFYPRKYEVQSSYGIIHADENNFLITLMALNATIQRRKELKKVKQSQTNRSNV